MMGGSWDATAVATETQTPFIFFCPFGQRFAVVAAIGAASGERIFGTSCVGVTGLPSGYSQYLVTLFLLVPGLHRGSLDI